MQTITINKNNMVSLYSILLSLCYFIGAYIGRKDIFSPRFIFNVFAWLKNIPYAVDYIRVNNIADETIDSYFFFKFISFICVNVGITIYEINSTNKKYVYLENKKRKNSAYLRTGIIVSVIGFVVKIKTILDSGGVFYILSHIQGRKEIMAGQYYNELFANSLLTCGVLLTLMCYLKEKRKKNLYIFIVIFVITTFGLIVFGARRPAMMLLLQVIMLYHFFSSKIRIRSLFKIKSIVTIFVIAFFVLLMPMLRSSSETDYINNPQKWVEGAVENTNTLFREFSYCDGDLFAFDYFKTHEYWYGASYLNIPLQIIPKSIYPQKPPMDDGMYLLNLMYGEKATPNMATDDLFYQTSVPFTLESSLYSNFGLLGIILGCLLVGVFYQYVYKVLISCFCPIVMILIYQEIIFVFVPSVLHTSSAIITFCVYWIIFKILFKFKIRRIQ